ncbi:ubiquitin thioesterase OTU1 [Venturia nashicola]|nr:ubiquitin thioesterase OTU1 [Venturia nashicola]
MRIGLQGAFGRSQINLDDSATVGDLLEKISEASSLKTFDLKGGFPPSLIDLSLYDPTTKLSETGVKLNGERLQVDTKGAGGGGVKQAPPASVVAKKDTTSGKEGKRSTSSQLNSIQPNFTHPPAASSSTNIPDKQLTLSKPAKAAPVEPPEVPIRDGTSYLVHRVMPDDNSCLFRAIGKCVLGDSLDAAVELRSMVAQTIQEQPDKYTAVVLEKNPDRYCEWIQTPDAWGGGIEIGIIAEVFGIEIYAINISDGSVQKFNEGASKLRSYLIYSGIHWDCLVENCAGKDGPGEIDVAQFDTFDDEILQKGLEIGVILKRGNYYTDVQKFGIVCNTCGWQGTGQTSATTHYKETSHTDFGQLS